MNMRTMITIGVVVVLGGFAIISGIGKTSAGSIDVGDCFEDPGAGGFSSVTDQDCAEPHDIQVFATSSGITSQCGDKFFDLLVSDNIIDNDAIVIPDDTLVGEIGEEGGGGGDALCFIESPSGGLVGSIIP